MALNKVYSKFDELVESYNGEELSEYNLRRIGSDLEHFIRSLLQKGEISYNLNARVQISLSKYQFFQIYSLSDSFLIWRNLYPLYSEPILNQLVILKYP